MGLRWLIVVLALAWFSAVSSDAPASPRSGTPAAVAARRPHAPRVHAVAVRTQLLPVMVRLSVPDLSRRRSASLRIPVDASPRGARTRAVFIQVSVSGPGTATFGLPSGATVSLTGSHRRGASVVGGGIATVQAGLPLRVSGRPRVTAYVVGLVIDAAGSADSLHWALGDANGQLPALTVAPRHPGAVSLPADAPRATGAALVAVTASTHGAGVLMGGPRAGAVAPILAAGAAGVSAVTALLPLSPDGHLVLSATGRFAAVVQMRVLAYAAPDGKGAPGASMLVGVHPLTGSRAVGGHFSVRVAGASGLPAATAVGPPTGALLSVQVMPGPGTAALLAVAGATNDGRILSDADAASPYVSLGRGQGTSTTMVVPLAADGSLRLRSTSRRVHVRLLGATAGDLLTRPGAHLLQRGDLSALVRVDDTSLLFRGTPAGLSAIRPGQVIVAGLSVQTPRGLLRKVTLVAHVGSDLLLHTAPAALGDVLAQGSVRVDTALTRQKMTAFQAMSPRVHLAPAGHAADDIGDIGVTFQTTFFPQSLVGGSSVSITGNGLHVSPQMHFSADASLFPPSVKAEFSVTAHETLDAHVHVEGGFRDLALSWRLARAFFAPIDIQIGPFPILFVPETEIDLGASGHADAHLDAGLSQSQDFTYGVGLDTTRDGGPFYVINNVSPNSVQLAAPRFGGSADLTVGPSIGLNAFIDYLIGPGVAVGPVLKLEADTQKNPWWHLFLGFDASVAFSFNLFDLSYSHTFLEVGGDLRTAGGPFATVDLTPKHPTVARGASQQFTATTTGGVSPDVNWHADGGTVSSSGLYQAPMRAGSYNITASSAEEPSAFDSTTITVPAQAPSAPNAVTATPAPAGADVSWSPPADDGGTNLSSYTVTASPGGITNTVPAGTTSSHFSGLDPRTSYTFTVTATNDARIAGSASAPSAPVNPQNNNYVVVQPASIAFPDTPVGATSAPQTVTVYASSLAALKVASVGLSGTNADQFVVQNDQCSGQTVAVNGSCTFAVAYRPTSTATPSAQATITDDDQSSPQTVSLSHVATTIYPGALTSVSFPDSTHGWAVGARVHDTCFCGSTDLSATVLRTTDGGAHWNRVETDTAQQLTGVSFVDDQHGWAVGDNGGDPTHGRPPVLIATTDGGTTWSGQMIPGGLTQLSAVHFIGTQHGYAVGTRTVTGGTRGALLSTSDGGANWTLASTPSGGLDYEHYDTIAFADAQHAVIAGGGYNNSDGITRGVVLHTSDGGQSWTLGSVGSELHSVSAGDASHWWGSDGTSVYTSADAGATWSTRSIPALGGAPPLAVAFSDLSHGWLLGGGTQSSNAPTVLTTGDGGGTWQGHSTAAFDAGCPLPPDTHGEPWPPYPSLSGLGAFDASHATIVGNETYQNGDTQQAQVAAVETSTNGGASWTTPPCW